MYDKYIGCRKQDDYDLIHARETVKMFGRIYRASNRFWNLAVIPASEFFHAMFRRRFQSYQRCENPC